MRKSRFTEGRIIGILKEVESGRTGQEVCREHGISDHTLYRWKNKYGGMEARDAKRLRVLEEENHKRVPRLYRKHRLKVPVRRRRHLKRVPRQPMTVPRRPNECWSMDFVHDRTMTGPLRTLSVLDVCTRQAPVLAAARSMPAERVMVTSSTMQR